VTLTTLKGITVNGEWVGEHYIAERFVQAGEYTIDILATLSDQTISKSSTMFIIGTVGGSSASNYAPVADAGSDQSHEDGAGVPLFTLGVSSVTLDGSGSSDRNNDISTYSWSFTTVPNTSSATLSDETTTSPSFIPDLVGTYVIVLTVTDERGKSSADSVTITVS